MKNKCYKYTARHGLTTYELVKSKSILKQIENSERIWTDETDKWIRKSNQTNTWQKHYEAKTSRKGQILVGYYDTPEKAILASLKKYYELQLNVRSKITIARKTLNKVMNQDKK